MALDLRNDTRGVVYAEFLIAFIPFLTMFLGMVQVGLFFTASLVVRQAATVAARAAVVVLPDDPKYYGDAEINVIDMGSGSTSSISVGGMNIPSGEGSRLGAIRAAASIPLLAVSPSHEQLTRSNSLGRATTNAESRFLTGATVYNRTAVAVTFPGAGSGSSSKISFSRRAAVTTRVTYLFHCGVPVVSRFLCDDYYSLRTGAPVYATQQLVRAQLYGNSDDVEAAQGHYDAAIARLDAAEPGLEELDHAETPWAGAVYSALGAHFAIIRADAQMTNQGAGFVYAD